MPRKRNPWISALASVWRGVDLARRLVLNLLFLLILALLLALSGDAAPEVPASAVLELAPSGVLVEQLSGTLYDRALARLIDEDVAPETLLSDLVEALQTARDDDRIKGLLIDADWLLGADLTKLQDLGSAIADFKTSGKPVIAAGDVFTNARYYLAAQADEIYLDELGLFMLEGFGLFRNYYKEAIDRLEVDWNVFRVGAFKSAVEPYTRTDMSPEAREANLDWMGDLWRFYLEDVATARDLEAGEIRRFIDEYVERQEAADGRSAASAGEAGLVDHVTAGEELRQRLLELTGAGEGGHTVPKIGHEDYLLAMRSKLPAIQTGGAVGVIVASGPILDGDHPPGVIGGDSVAKLVRQARLDGGISAVVLRVDSGGGSVTASEVIRRELELLREEGKPLVASMGSYAASGGYWIATPAEQIWASPATVTGSIGIFGMFPTFQKPLARHLGVRVDGVGTTWMAGAVRPDRPLDPRFGRSLQLSLESGYRDFIELVAESRGMSLEEVEQVAGGRVWSGQDAHRLGLVDELGGLDGAIAAAAELAGLGAPKVRYLEPEIDASRQMLVDMLARASAWLPAAKRSGPTLESRFQRWLGHRLAALKRFNDPRGLYADCECRVD